MKVMAPIFRITALIIVWGGLLFLSSDGFLFMETPLLEFLLSIIFLLTAIIITFTIWCGPDITQKLQSRSATDHENQSPRSPVVLFPNSTTRKLVTWELVIGGILLLGYITLNIVGEVISKPLLVESEEVINAYTGDGEATYLRAPSFGIDGVSIKMPPFYMTDGLEMEYDLSGIPSGSPYSIDLMVSLGYGRTDALVNSISKGQWTYRIKRNGQVIKTLSDKLGNIHIAGSHEEPYISDELEFSFFSLEEGHSTDHHLEIGDTNNTWSIAVSFTNEILKKPLEAYLVLSRGGGK